jgi:glycosyltransferase involved in cell wall biosynthesis
MTWVGEHRLAGVITHSALAHDAFVEAGVPAERVLVAHNGFAPSLMEPRLSRDEARRSLGLSGDRPLAVYTGHVGPQKGTKAVVSLAAALPDIRLSSWAQTATPNASG